MNNKKLFKGALVLFASILMAVSCSSNSNPGDDGKGSGNAETPQVKEIGIAEYLAALKSLGATYKPVEDEEVTWNFTAIATGDFNTGNKQLESTSSAQSTKSKVKVAVVKDITAKMKTAGFTVTVEPGSDPSADAAYDFTVKITKAEENFKLKDDITSHTKLKVGGAGFIVKIKPKTGQNWK